MERDGRHLSRLHLGEALRRHSLGLVQVTQQRGAPGHHAVGVDLFKQFEPILEPQPLP